ncbi:sigma-70 family RNA polymerase sigma factor [bacterium]|nr:sigma-70 family RNA polymerase sigma factor [bacterium]
MADNGKTNYSEIKALLQAYKGAVDEKQKRQLQNVIVLACMPLVKRIARGLARRSTDPVEDIIQVGSVGLVKAIHFYNPEVSENFRTYATYLITGEIRHYLRDKAAMIKAPREIYELSYRVNMLISKLRDPEGNEPTPDALANELDVPVKRVKEVFDIDRRKQTVSLDQAANALGDVSFSLFDKIADDNYYNLEQFQEDKIIISDAVNTLDDNLKEVIELFFYEDLSQTQISTRLHISQMQVSRRLKKALKILFGVLAPNYKDELHLDESII